MNFFFDDLESFRPSDDGTNKVSEQAAEAFREQMRKASAQMKALQKGEQKKKKKEDRLAKIISEFLKKKTKTDLVLLAAQVLAESIPPNFVLGMLILSDRESLEEGHKILAEEGRRLQPFQLDEEERDLIPEANGEIVDWVNLMGEYGAQEGLKLLENIKNQDGKLKYILVEFMTAVLEDYFQEKNMSFDRENLKNFTIHILRKVVAEIQQNLEHLEVLREQDFTAGEQV